MESCLRLKMFQPSAGIKPRTEFREKKIMTNFMVWSFDNFIDQNSPCRSDSAFKSDPRLFHPFAAF